ncbi:hypothetical protein OAC63_00770 [Amylibacter sp.]|jgi:hypothetical protein|nr:hypothetical protein [Paracoccaceae bacterium]MDB9856909.1 hypothetical protein [Amylibacter sp.]
MFGWLRLAVIGLFFLTIVYICLSWYSRSVRREKLEKQFDASKEQQGPREQFIDGGLKAYEGSLRAKLIWGVYVIPIILVVVMIYVANFM